MVEPLEIIHGRKRAVAASLHLIVDVLNVFPKVFDGRLDNGHPEALFGGGRFIVA